MLDGDSDGLQNLVEYEHNTNPAKKDTDDDGLDDDDEIYIYFTDPVELDTDSDGMPSSSLSLSNGSELYTISSL